MARKTFSAVFVKSVTTGGKPQVEFFDAGCRGLSLKVGKGGAKAWRFAFTVPRHARRKCELLHATTPRSARSS